MRVTLPGVAVVLGGAALPVVGLHAQQANPAQGPAAPISVQIGQAGPVAQPAPAAAAPADCTGTSDPYKNYACLDAYLGDNVFERLYNYYKLEWGQPGPPSDLRAPPQRRAGWPDAPETTPPMPFTEWPYGGTTSLGVTRTGSVDSPLMVAIANTSIGKALNEAGIQIYGWIDPGFNFSSNPDRKPGGNAPIAYAYIPNTIQLDQAVLYVDRFPDTVQTDHIDWGMRLSAIYGENYRYTQSYGILSYQFNKYNSVNGWDFPMMYGELYIPFVAKGLMIRVGRYISLPDIEAQLAPNNYMYTHSLTYSYDNYTNEGILGSLAITKNVILQLGVSAGTEATLWHVNTYELNPAPTVVVNGVTVANPLYGGKFKTDPGAVPSFTACLRVDWNNGHDNLIRAPTPSTAANGATTICSGTARPTITNSTTTGTSRTNSTTCTRMACRT